MVMITMTPALREAAATASAILGSDKLSLVAVSEALNTLNDAVAQAGVEATKAQRSVKEGYPEFELMQNLVLLNQLVIMKALQLLLPTAHGFDLERQVLCTKVVIELAQANADDN